MYAKALRFLLTIGIALLLATPVIAAGSFTVQRIDTADYPTVHATVTVPPALQGSKELGFSVLENGDDVGDVKVASVKAAAVPAQVVLVIDTSGSMQGAPLADAKRAADAFIASLGADASVAIVAFSDEPRVVARYTSDRAVLSKAIASLQARGETALYDALVSSASLVRASEATGRSRRSMIVLSDGGDTVSDASFEKTVAAVRAADTPVYAVALKSAEYNPHALELMAKSTGGRLVPASRSSEFSDLFTGIAREINSAYTLTWTSGNPRTKDIDVDVVATADGREVRSTTVYPNPSYAGLGSGSFIVPEVTDNPALFFGAIVVGALAVAMLVLGLMLIVMRERTSLQQLRYYDQLHTSELASQGAGDQVRERVVEAVGYVAGKRGLTQLASQKLEAAGLPLRPAEYITGHILFVIATSVMVQLLSGRVLFSMIIVLLATIVPMVLIENAAERRRQRFEEQLPDVLGMLAGSLRGGWGIQQAIALAADEAPSPAAEEFRRVDTETRLGIPLERSLQSMADRMASIDFQAAVTAIAIQREVGGNLAEVLDIVAKTIRERESMRRQVRALTAEGRLSAWILIALPFVVLVLLAFTNPLYIAPLFTTVAGIGIVVVGALMLLVGSIWLWRVTRIEV